MRRRTGIREKRKERREKGEENEERRREKFFFVVANLSVSDGWNNPDLNRFMGNSLKRRGLGFMSDKKTQEFPAFFCI